MRRYVQNTINDKKAHECEKVKTEDDKDIAKKIRPDSPISVNSCLI